MQLWDNKLQCRKWFFDNLVGKYHVTTVHDVTHNGFIVMCKYLADNKAAKESSSTFLVTVMMEVSTWKTVVL